MKLSALALALALVAGSGLTVAAFAQTPTPAPATKATKAHKAVHHKAPHKGAAVTTNTTKK